MNTPLEEPRFTLGLHYNMDFTNPILADLEYEIRATINTHQDPKTLEHALFSFYPYLPRTSSAAQNKKYTHIIKLTLMHKEPKKLIEAFTLLESVNIELTDRFYTSLCNALKTHNDPVALIKAVIFFAPKGLIFVERNTHAKSNFQRIILEATTLFDNPGLDVYFNKVRLLSFSQEDFNKLIKHKDYAENKLHPFLIACVLCEMDAVQCNMESTQLEDLKSALGIMVRFLKDEYYLLTQKETLLKIPTTFQQAVYPMLLAQSIIKISNSNLLILRNQKSTSNFSQLIRHSKLWFDDIKLKQSFDEISSQDITQVFFDKLVMISDENETIKDLRAKLFLELNAVKLKTQTNIKPATPLKLKSSHPWLPETVTQFFSQQKGFFPSHSARGRSKTENDEELSESPKLQRQHST